MCIIKCYFGTCWRRCWRALPLHPCWLVLFQWRLLTFITEVVYCIYGNVLRVGLYVFGAMSRFSKFDMCGDPPCLCTGLTQFFLIHNLPFWLFSQLWGTIRGLYTTHGHLVLLTALCKPSADTWPIVLTIYINWLCRTSSHATRLMLRWHVPS